MFGSRQTGYYLRKFAWTKIVRHARVASRCSVTLGMSLSVPLSRLSPGPMPGK